MIQKILVPKNHDALVKQTYETASGQQTANSWQYRMRRTNEFPIITYYRMANCAATWHKARQLTCMHH